MFCTVNSFCEAEGIDWSKVKAVCTDGAPSMLGRNYGFQALVNEVSPDVIANHCMIHREALAEKTLPDPLNNVWKDVFKVVKYVKSSALNTRLFRNLCGSMEADHKDLFFHTEVRWLSRGNVLQRVFDVRVELKAFLMVQGNAVWASLFLDEDWLSYLSDIFERLNVLNLSLQGRDSNILVFCNKLLAFQGRLDLWASKVASGRHAMFPRLSLFVDLTLNTLNRVHSTPDSSATSAGAWKLTTRICSSTQRFAGFHVEMCCSGSSM